jgi:hypothetical protein
LPHQLYDKYGTFSQTTLSHRHGHVASQDAEPAGHEHDADAQRRNYGEVNEMKKAVPLTERRRLNWSALLKVDLGKWPRLKEYIARVAARPAVQEAMSAEGLRK